MQQRHQIEMEKHELFSRLFKMSGFTRDFGSLSILLIHLFVSPTRFLPFFPFISLHRSIVRIRESCRRCWLLNLICCSQSPPLGNCSVRSGLTLDRRIMLVVYIKISVSNGFRRPHALTYTYLSTCLRHHRDHVCLQTAPPPASDNAKERCSKSGITFNVRR